MNTTAPKSHCFRPRILPIGLAASFLVSVAVKPVRAEIADFLGDPIFGDIYSVLASFFPKIVAVDQWISLIEDGINDPCEAAPILFATPSEPGWCTAATDILGGNGSITSILQEVAGDLGIPDAQQARATIQKKVDEAGDTPDPFILNPEIYGIQLGNLSERTATSLSVKTVLSKAMPYP